MTPKKTDLLVAALIVGATLTPLTAKADNTITVGKLLDLSKVAPAKQEAVQAAFRKGLLEGDQNGNFRPQDVLTRQEMAVLLAKAMKLSPVTSGTSTFNDVPSNEWSQGYIEAVRKAGLMGGDENNDFRPNDSISREELAAVFVRAVNGAGARGGQKTEVSDASSVSAWAGEAVDTALRLGLIDTPDQKINPKESLKRQDIVTMLLDVFQTEEKSAQISQVIGDTVIINGTPYLIEGKLKDLLGDRNKEALKGAVIQFKSTNRSVGEIGSLDIVQNGAVLDTGSAAVTGTIKISANDVTVKGQSIQQIEIGKDVSRIRLDSPIQQVVVSSQQPLAISGSGQLNQVKVNQPDVKITLSTDLKIAKVDLPDQVKLSQIFPEVPNVAQITGVSTGVDDRQTSGGSGTSSSSSSRRNEAPVATSASLPLTLSIAGGDKQMNLADMFKDPDGDSLTFTAFSSDSELAIAALNGSTLIITPKKAGTVTITIKASDGDGESATSSVAVLVTAPPNPSINHAPVAATVLNAVYTSVTSGVQTVNLTGAFTDQDGDSLVYSAVSDNPGVATVNVSGSNLQITPVNAGQTVVTVKATDPSSASAQTTLSVTFTVPVPSNHAPTVANVLSAVYAQVTDGLQTVSLANTFADQDGDSLELSAVSSNTGAATVSVSGTDLLITPLNAGTTTVTITAKDSQNATVQTTLAVTITAPNHAPTVTNAPSPVSYISTAGAQTVSLAYTFADQDGDSLELSAVSSNTGAATVSVSGTDLLITPLNAGTTTVTITAKDSHNATVQTTLAVTITAPAVNHAPTVANTISPVTYGSSDGNKNISLTTVFQDADGDTLTYSATSSDPSVATVSTSGSNLVITPVAAGTTTVTVTATDSHQATVSTTVTVTIEQRGLFFSEAIFGTADNWSGFFQVIELYNPTDSKLDGSKIRITSSNVDISPFVLSGTEIDPHSAKVIVEAFYEDSPIYTTKPTDYSASMGFYDLTDPVTLSLYYDNVLMDVMTYTPGKGLVRKSSVKAGSTSGHNAAQWDEQLSDTTSNLGTFTPAP